VLTEESSGDPAHDGRPPLTRLFCLPWAGGSAAAYRSWGALLGPRFAVVPVELPGRGRRYAQPLCTSMDEAVGWLLAELAGEMGRGPFAIFGHSLGGMLGFQLTHELVRHGLPSPAHLFISAARPPHRRGPEPLHTLSNQALLAELARLNGAPAHLLAHQDLQEILMPVIRADLRIADTWRAPAAPPLTVPVSFFSGRDDPLAPAAELAHWRPYFAGPVTYREYGGDHFYLHTHGSELLADLRSGLSGQD